ncbi:hypothetical protein K523DRAFT_108880 [Schizophyllum commune Tattone D]|nr:hypothetical protein K523DRAFT_108880 [Schizophyllum commune Tattone D]
MAWPRFLQKYAALPWSRVYVPCRCREMYSHAPDDGSAPVLAQDRAAARSTGRWIDVNGYARADVARRMIDEHYPHHQDEASLREQKRVDGSSQTSMEAKS